VLPGLAGHPLHTVPINQPTKQTNKQKTHVPFKVLVIEGVSF